MKGPLMLIIGIVVAVSVLFAGQPAIQQDEYEKAIREAEQRRLEHMEFDLRQLDFSLEKESSFGFFVVVGGGSSGNVPYYTFYRSNLNGGYVLERIEQYINSDDISCVTIYENDSEVKAVRVDDYASGCVEGVWELYIPSGALRNEINPNID